MLAYSSQQFSNSLLQIASDVMHMAAHLQLMDNIQKNRLSSEAVMHGKAHSIKMITFGVYVQHVRVMCVAAHSDLKSNFLCDFHISGRMCAIPHFQMFVKYMFKVRSMIGIS